MTSLGRPTKLTRELVVKAEDYADDGWRQGGDAVPSIVALSAFIAVSKRTIHNWKREAERVTSSELLADFLHTLEGIHCKQHTIVLNSALKGEFNASIAKLLLHNHGYSGKLKTDSTQTHRGIEGLMRSIQANHSRIGD